MVTLKLTLFGGFEGQLASGANLDLPTKKAQALLAYLGAHPGRRHSRDKLAALLWGEKSDHRARGDLRHALVALRRALASADPEPLQIEDQALVLAPGSVEVDVVTFERHVAEGTPAALEQAALVYRGDLLLGFTLNEPLFEEWLVSERERLREMALEVLARLLAHQTELGSTERAIQTAMRLLSLDPLQEAVHRALMRLYARQGRRGTALKQYQACVGALRRELGTEPEAETRALYQDLVRRPADATKAPDAAEPRRVRSGRAVAPPPPDLPAAETPLFGRQAERDQLRKLLDTVIQGRGGVASVVGDAGIGKTRIVSALAADALDLGCQVLIGRCHESDSILPFGPWVDALRAGQVSANEAILANLHPARRAELTRLFPEASVADLPRPADTALALFEAVADLVEQVAAERPLVLVLEDLHWADDMSLRLFAFVSRRVQRSPALLLATARADELVDADMARRTIEDATRGFEGARVALAPLSKADTGLLVGALARVGSDSLLVAEVMERVWAMSEGNPFVAVEAMRALDREAVWAAESGKPGRPSLPASVRDLVVRRLERLSGGSQQLAGLAAVIGRRFDFALLRSASGLADREAAEAVEELVRHRVLQALGAELDFTHDRVRDVAYEQLLPPRRQLLHRAVAEALEAGGAGAISATAASLGDRSSEQIEQLARHALRGELREKAVRYLRQAGRKAAARSALEDARAWFGQALDTLQTLPECRATLEEAFEARLELRPVLSQLGEYRRTREVLRETEALAERLNDDARRCRVAAFMANIHTRLNELDEALVSGKRALDIGTRLGDSRLRVLATTYLVQAHSYRGDYARAVELATASLSAQPHDRVDEPFDSSQPSSVYDRYWVVVGLANLGRFAEAAGHAAEAIRLAEATHHPFAVGLACHAAQAWRLVKGDWAEAHAMNEREIAVLRTGKIVEELLMALAYSARTLAYLGDTSRAVDRLRECAPLLDSQSARGVENGWVDYALARAHLLLGWPDEAERLADRAVRSVSGRSDFVPNTLHLLGDIATRPDRFDAEQGEVRYRKALALAEARGMRPLAAHCHLGLGTLHGRLGKRQQAAEHLNTATTMYCEMDMRFWLERAEAERTALA